jgi:hypothetical protein
VLARGFKKAFGGGVEKKEKMYGVSSKAAIDAVNKTYGKAKGG